MKDWRFVFPMLITCLLLSGCIDIGGENDTDEDDPPLPRWNPYHGDARGEEYLDEFESMVVYTLDLGIGEHLVNITAFMSWYDEPPDNRVREYENFGDQFTLMLKDGNSIQKLHSYENNPEYQGNARVYHIAPAADQQTSETTSIWVEVKLDFAGDQYAKATDSEQTKIEDTGNAFTWSVTYTSIREVPADP